MPKLVNGDNQNDWWPQQRMKCMQEWYACILCRDYTNRKFIRYFKGCPVATVAWNLVRNKTHNTCCWQHNMLGVESGWTHDYSYQLWTNKKRKGSAMTFANLDRYLVELEKFGISGTDCCIYLDGTLVYRHINGLADRENRVPIRENTLYRMFSMTKPITCVAMMQLY